MERGLRHGDRILSFLFIITSKCLNFIFNEAINKTLIVGVYVSFDNILVSHLQYADDTLIFIFKDLTTI